LVITQSSYLRFRQFLRTAPPTYPVVFRSVQSSILNRHHQIRNSSALNNEHAIFGVVRPEDDKNTVRSRSRVYPDGDDKENIFSEISTLDTYEPIRSVRVPLAFVCSCLCQYTTVSVSALSRARESPLFRQFHLQPLFKFSATATNRTSTRRLRYREPLTKLARKIIATKTIH
jgi:hypothetical protein